jgi:hypothetical protein
MSTPQAFARNAFKEAWEVEHHVHGVERWLGSAEDTPFSLAGANDDWGAWTTVMEPGDTPIIAGSTHFDAHRVEFADVSNAANKKPTKFQIAWSEAVDGEAAAIIAGCYTEFIAAPEKDGKATPVDLMMPRLATGNWYLFMRMWVFGIDASVGTTDVFGGIHEYTDPDV